MSINFADWILNRRSRRRFCVALPLGLALLAFAACVVAAPSNARPKATRTKTDSPRPTPNNVGISGPRSYIEQPDPRHRGKLLWKMWVRNLVVESPVKTVYVTLTGISGVLFSKGEPSATLKAPLGRGNNADSVIVASGRVTVTSLVQKGTWLQADTVTWFAKKNKGVANGNVVLRNGKTGLTVHTPRLYFDTALKTIQSSAGYGTLP